MSLSQIFAIELEDNAEICHKRNIHNRSLEDIEAVLKKFNKTPEDQQLLDATSILVVKKEEPKADAGEDVKPPDVKMDTEDISDEEVEADDVIIISKAVIFLLIAFIFFRCPMALKF